jgi:PAB1-binding protein PBP1
MARNTRRASRKNRKNTRKAGRKQEGGSSMLPPTMMGGKMPAVGSKAEVFHGTAKHTSGGLTKKDLVKTKRGRIVSRRKQAAGKKAILRLRKAGYVAKKGKFTLFSKKSKRGGSESMMPDASANGMPKIM